MCFTLRLLTANYMTQLKLLSAVKHWLAMFLCIKISPGFVYVNSLGGTLLSEQPIRRYSGDYPFDKFLKYSGSSISFSATYSEFP